MVRMGAMDEDKGITDIFADKQRIAEIQGELRVACLPCRRSTP
jgi:hypothetical protein